MYSVLTASSTLLLSAAVRDEERENPFLTAAAAVYTGFYYTKGFKAL